MQNQTKNRKSNYTADCKHNLRSVLPNWCHFLPMTFIHDQFWNQCYAVIQMPEVKLYNKILT